MGMIEMHKIYPWKLFYFSGPANSLSLEFLQELTQEHNLNNMILLYQYINLIK